MPPGELGKQKYRHGKRGCRIIRNKNIWILDFVFRYLFEFLAKRVFSGGKWIAELEGRFRGASTETLAGAHVIGTFAIFSWWFSCRKGATGRLKTGPYFSWVSIDAASAKYRNTRYLLFWRK